MVLLFLFLFPKQTEAQKLNFTNYTIQNGLPQNTVMGICQDQQGYLWFATQVGAGRFDGYEFEYFTVSKGLPDNQVNCLLSSSNGEVWFGTEGGVAAFDGKLFRTYDAERGLVDNRVDRLEEDLDGNIWVMTAYGISIITPDTLLTYTKKDALVDNVVKDFYVDSNGQVHISTFPDFGLTVFSDPFNYQREETEYVIADMLEGPEGNTWYATHGEGILVQKETGQVKLGYNEGLSDLDVLCIMKDGQDRIWCSTFKEGLFVFENGKFQKSLQLSREQLLLVDMHEDMEGRLWFVDYDQGVWLKDEQGFRHLTTKNGLVYDIVTQIFEDANGSIWFATLSGASKYGRAIFEVFDEEFILSDENILSAFADSKDRIWFGSYDNLMFLEEGEVHAMDDSLGFKPGTLVYDFKEDEQGRIYLGTQSGLWIYHKGRFQELEEKVIWERSEITEMVEDRRFFSLHHASNGTLWCGTDYGLVVLENHRMIDLEQQDAYMNLQIRAFDQVVDHIYSASEMGIHVFDLEANLVKTIGTDDGLPSDNCLDLIHDRENNLWVATDRGLAKIGWDSGEVELYGTDKKLPTNAIYFVEFQNNDELFIGTERGLYRLNIQTEEVKFYGMADGFYPLETNRGAISAGSNGNLWMGTVEGLVHYIPTYDQKDTVPPRLLLYPPQVDKNGYVSMEDSISGIATFSYHNNSLTFRFTGIHTTVPENNRFSYILEGYDEHWSEPGLQREVPYKKLPNGHYTFRVKAYNLDGVATDSDATFEFMIRPPFWKTAWFILLEVIFGLLLIYGIIKYRERQLIREKRILESRVKQRTREIEDQKVEIEAQRDEIFEQNKEITSSIQYAKRIQQAVLPGKLMLEKTLPEHFILFKPRDIVSGDFYWVDQRNDRIVVCAADCTGHGVPGAFMSLLGLTFLNEIVNKDGILKANAILNRLRSYIKKAMTHKDTQARDGMDLSLIVIDRQMNMLDFSGAYNPLVIVREGELLEYKADKMPIGRHEGEERTFTSHKIALREGDMIYMFSDGFPDQFGGDKGGKYKAKPFKRQLLALSSESTEMQEQILEKELRTWMGELEQVDDILVMGIRYQSNSQT